MRARINRTRIAALQPDPARKVWLYDADLTGFLVVCHPSGKRSYMVRYRTAGGDWRKITIGQCEAMAPDDAREIARATIANAARGIDPTRERGAPTVADLAARFMSDHAARQKSGTARNYEILWRRHILPRLGGLRVADIKRADVARLHDAMRATPINANRALEVVAKACELAEVWGWRDEGTNPTRHVRAFGEDHRQRTLTDGEVAALWRALDAYAAGQAVPAAQAIKLILLTGRRKSEWLTARWDFIDWQRGTLALPDTKTGAKVFHLPAEALDILRALPRASVYILPGRTGGPIGGLTKIWGVIRASAGLPDVRLHDLRHTVGSAADRAGMSQRQIADLLGHAQISTTARYVNSHDEHKKATVQAWASVVTAMKKPASG